MASPQSFPSELPGMVLPGCNLVPNNDLPLYIFEPRYRQMLSDVLDGGRLFFVVQAKEEGVPLDPELGNSYPVGTVGMVKACVKNDDGTAHVFLHGMRRIRLKRLCPKSVYPLAMVDYIPTTRRCEEAIAEAQRALLAMIDGLSEGCRSVLDFVDALRSVEKAELCADRLGAKLIRDPELLREFLSQECLLARYQLLTSLLQAHGREG